MNLKLLENDLRGEIGVRCLRDLEGVGSKELGILWGMYLRVVGVI
jgi:hypothetical protein